MNNDDQDREKVQSQKQPKTEREILEYWTQKRKDEAKPLPMPTPAAPSSQGGQQPPDGNQGN